MWRIGIYFGETTEATLDGGEMIGEAEASLGGRRQLGTRRGIYRNDEVDRCIDMFWFDFPSEKFSSRNVSVKPRARGRIGHKRLRNGANAARPSMPQKTPLGRQTIARVARVAEIMLQNHWVSRIGLDTIDPVVFTTVNARERSRVAPAGAGGQAACKREQRSIARGGEFNHGPSPQ